MVWLFTTYDIGIWQNERANLVQCLLKLSRCNNVFSCHCQVVIEGTLWTDGGWLEVYYVMSRCCIDCTHSLRNVEAEHTTLKRELPALRADNDELRKVWCWFCLHLYFVIFSVADTWLFMCCNNLICLFLFLWSCLLWNQFLLWFCVTDVAGLQVAFYFSISAFHTAY